MQNTPPTTAIRTFRDLVAWQLGKKMALLMYQRTQAMPDRERFGLTSQMRRAAVSVPSNIAEGYGVGTTPGFLRHLRLARGSLAEVDTQLELAVELGLIPRCADILDLVAETDRVLQGLIRSLERKQAAAEQRDS